MECHIVYLSFFISSGLSVNTKSKPENALDILWQKYFIALKTWFLSLKYINNDC